MTHTTMTAYPMPEHADRYMSMQAKMAERIALLRFLNKMPIEKARDRTGIPIPLIQAYEQGFTPIPLHTYWVLCHGIDADPTELFLFTEKLNVMEYLPDSCHGFY